MKIFYKTLTVMLFIIGCITNAHMAINEEITSSQNLFNLIVLLMLNAILIILINKEK